MPAPTSRPAPSADGLDLEPAPPVAPAADSRLDGLIQRTSVEELARAGKRNLKTVSERSLRELIRQLVADAIARHAEGMAEADRAQVLASVQGELKQTLAAHQAEAAKRQALADRVAALEAELALERSRLATAADTAAELMTRTQELESAAAHRAYPSPTPFDPGAELLVEAALELDEERFDGEHLAAAEVAGRGGDVRRAAALDTIGAASHRLAELEEALASSGVRIS
ncbi:MAG: hypothetical protein RLZZ127_1682 [Planctomycetota bacterium]|jgi:hypothetical protein